MLKLSKRVKTVIILVVFAIVVGVSILISKAISENSYDISEIVGETETSATISVKEEWEVNGVPVSKAIYDLYNLERGEMSDEEFATASALSILSNSPMCEDIYHSSYEVKKSDNKWVTKFICKEFDLFVYCDDEHYSPYMYVCTRKFNDEELKFFHSLGHVWEVQNEDGSYTLYYM